MSSNRFVFLVLISLLLMGVPLDNAEQSSFSETEIVSSVGENLEDYELFLDSVDGDDAITTIQPEGNQIEASLLGTGIQFESEEMISDLTVKGKSNDEVKILVFLKWRASQNTSTAEASFKLYSGSDLVEQVTEDLGDPQSAGLFGGSDSWQPYTILLDVGSSGFVVENGDRLKLDIEATASCEGGGDGSPFGGSTCEVDIAYGGTVGNEYSRLELRANALSGSQVKVHYQGEGWSEVEVTEWSPTHRIEKRTMQFSVDVRDAFGREDIEKIELVLSTPNNANTVFEKEFTDSDLKLDNDGLVGNYSFTYDSGITPGLYPLTMVITDVQGHSINYEHPESVKTLISDGHEVLVENNGGFEAGFDNEQFKSVGAKIIDKAEDIFNDAEIIVKVKEPLSNEVKMIRENQIIFTYLHLAAAKDLTQGLINSKSVCIAYETVTDENGRLPLLAPMSAVAGRMSVQAGAHCLEKNQNGRGILLGGAPGGEPAEVVILGGGVVGENAAMIATGMRAKVNIVDKSEARLKQLSNIFGDKIIPQLSEKVDLEKLVSNCDLLVGGVLIPGAEAPKLVTKKMIKNMKRGSVIVDVAIDQGGCVETSKPTTHAEPTYIVDDVVHYCVANMPGGVPRTSTIALNKATLPFLSKLANFGYQKTLKEDKNFLDGLNIYKGQVTYKAVADAFGHNYSKAKDILN